MQDQQNDMKQGNGENGTINGRHGVDGLGKAPVNLNKMSSPPPSSENLQSLGADRGTQKTPNGNVCRSTIPSQPHARQQSSGHVDTPGSLVHHQSPVTSENSKRSTPGVSPTVANGGPTSNAVSNEIPSGIQQPRLSDSSIPVPGTPVETIGGRPVVKIAPEEVASSVVVKEKKGRFKVLQDAPPAMQQQQQQQQKQNDVTQANYVQHTKSAPKPVVERQMSRTTFSHANKPQIQSSERALSAGSLNIASAPPSVSKINSNSSSQTGSPAVTVPSLAGPIVKKKGRFVVTSAEAGDAKTIARQASQMSKVEVVATSSQVPEPHQQVVQPALLVSVPVVTKQVLQNQPPSQDATPLVSQVPRQVITHGAASAVHSNQQQYVGQSQTPQDVSGTSLPQETGSKPPIPRPRAASTPSRTKSASTFDSKIGGSAVGFGKVFYFLDQMKQEVTEADRTIKTMQKDAKHFKEKNKELEAKVRDFQKRWKDEKAAREAAEAKVKSLKKRVRELKGMAAAETSTTDLPQGPQPNNGSTDRLGSTSFAGSEEDGIDMSQRQARMSQPDTDPMHVASTMNGHNVSAPGHPIDGGTNGNATVDNGARRERSVSNGYLVGTYDNGIRRDATGYQTSADGSRRERKASIDQLSPARKDWSNATDLDMQQQQPPHPPVAATSFDPLVSDELSAISAPQPSVPTSTFDPLASEDQSNSVATMQQRSHQLQPQNNHHGIIPIMVPGVGFATSGDLGGNIGVNFAALNQQQVALHHLQQPNLMMAPAGFMPLAALGNGMAMVQTHPQQQQGLMAQQLAQLQASSAHAASVNALNGQAHLPTANWGSQFGISAAPIAQQTQQQAYTGLVGQAPGTINGVPPTSASHDPFDMLASRRAPLAGPPASVAPAVGPSIQPPQQQQQPSPAAAPPHVWSSPAPTLS